jgi:glycosyltransferase involved in cell wall biosynthesis
MTNLVSVIVPVYNVEKYVSRCVDSLLKQSYLNVEIVLVDDGSTDNSGLICDEYAKKDKRVKVIHRNNGGLSAARNVGIKKSLGEYLAFVDGDDYVSNDFVSFLMKLLTQNGGDVAQCGHFIQYSEKRKVEKNSNHETIVLNRVQAIESLCYNGEYDVTAWNKLYKRSVFNNVSFPVGMLYEDTATSYRLAENADRFVVSMEPKYFYVQRYDSIANGTNFNNNKYQFIKVGDDMASYVEKKYPSLYRGANAKKCFVRLSTLAQLVNARHYDKARIKSMRKVIGQLRLGLLMDSKVSKRDKLGAVAIGLGFPFYSFVWSKYYKQSRKID